jgi:hypothetical protein
MTIKWTGDQREVPKLGIFTAGDIRELPDDIAKALINQGMAIKAPQKKGKEE